MTQQITNKVKYFPLLELLFWFFCSSHWIVTAEASKNSSPVAKPKSSSSSTTSYASTMTLLKTNAANTTPYPAITALCEAKCPPIATPPCLRRYPTSFATRKFVWLAPWIKSPLWPRKIINSAKSWRPARREESLTRFQMVWPLWSRIIATRWDTLTRINEDLRADLRRHESHLADLRAALQVSNEQLVGLSEELKRSHSGTSVAAGGERGGGSGMVREGIDGGDGVGVDVSRQRVTAQLEARIQRLEGELKAREAERQRERDEFMEVLSQSGKGLQSDVEFAKQVMISSFRQFFGIFFRNLFSERELRVCKKHSCRVTDIFLTHTTMFWKTEINFTRWPFYNKGEKWSPLWWSEWSGKNTDVEVLMEIWKKIQRHCLGKFQKPSGLIGSSQNLIENLSLKVLPPRRRYLGRVQWMFYAGTVNRVSFVVSFADFGAEHRTRPTGPAHRHSRSTTGQCPDGTAEYVRPFCPAWGGTPTGSGKVCPSFSTSLIKNTRRYFFLGGGRG